MLRRFFLMLACSFNAFGLRAGFWADTLSHFVRVTSPENHGVMLVSHAIRERGSLGSLVHANKNFWKPGSPFVARSSVFGNAAFRLTNYPVAWPDSGYKGDYLRLVIGGLGGYCIAKNLIDVFDCQKDLQEQYPSLNSCFKVTATFFGALSCANTEGTFIPLVFSAALIAHVIKNSRNYIRIPVESDITPMEKQQELRRELETMRTQLDALKEEKASADEYEKGQELAVRALQEVIEALDAKIKVLEQKLVIADSFVKNVMSTQNDTDTFKPNKADAT